MPTLTIRAMSDAPIISKSTFFGISIAAFGAGVAYGMRRVFKRETISLDIRGVHRTPFSIASRALLMGTGLCFGSFTVGSAFFLSYTGINTTRQLKEYLELRFSGVEELKVKNESVQQDMEKMSKLSEKEQMDEIWRQIQSNPAPSDSKEK